MDARRFRCICGVTAFAAVPQAALAGGPWPQPQGHGFAITTLGFLTAENTAGIPNPAYGDGRYGQYLLSSYIEYGLTDKLTLGAMPEFEVAQLRTAQRTLTTTGFSDLELFARNVAWQESQWSVAVQGTLKLPTGYNPNTNPALGNGQVDIQPSVSAGRGFNIGRWASYGYIEAGYRFRFAGPNDQVRINLVFGTHPANRWTIQLQSFNIINAVQPPRGINFNLDSVVANLVYDVSSRWSVQFGLFTQAVATNFNTGSGVSTGVWCRF